MIRRFRIAMRLSILVGLIVCSIHCKWPWEYANDNELPAAPPPPTVTQPHADTTIWWAIVARATFDWMLVEGAQSYDVEIDSSPAFISGEDDPLRLIFTATAPPKEVVLADSRRLPDQRYYYRIRAVSKNWHDGMTEWSATRWFKMRYQQGD